MVFFVLLRRCLLNELPSLDTCALVLFSFYIVYLLIFVLISSGYGCDFCCVCKIAQILSVYSELWVAFCVLCCVVYQHAYGKKSLNYSAK
jgi:hypothetical protein